MSSMVVALTSAKTGSSTSIRLVRLKVDEAAFQEVAQEEATPVLPVEEAPTISTATMQDQEAEMTDMRMEVSDLATLIEGHLVDREAEEVALLQQLTFLSRRLLPRKSSSRT